MLPAGPVQLLLVEKSGNCGYARICSRISASVVDESQLESTAHVKRGNLRSI